MDALLGAAAIGDIGKLFPDSDEKYSGADSIVLLKTVYKLLNSKGFHLINADCTIIAQRPKLSPYIDEMKNNVSKALECDPDCISIKATKLQHS